MLPARMLRRGLVDGRDDAPVGNAEPQQRVIVALEGAALCEELGLHHEAAMHCVGCPVHHHLHQQQAALISRCHRLCHKLSRASKHREFRIHGHSTRFQRRCQSDIICEQKCNEERISGRGSSMSKHLSSARTLSPWATSAPSPMRMSSYSTPPGVREYSS